MDIDSGSPAGGTDCNNKRTRGGNRDSIMDKLASAGRNVDAESLASLVYASVAQADVDARRELLGNIQIVGGGALIQGLSNRLAHELSEIVPTHLKVSFMTICRSLFLKHQ